MGEDQLLNEDDQNPQFGDNNLLVNHLSLETILDKLDWTAIFNEYGIVGKYPGIIYQSDEAERLYDSIMLVIHNMIIDNEIDLSMRVTFTETSLVKSDIVLQYFETNKIKCPPIVGFYNIKLVDNGASKREIICSHLIEAAWLWMKDQIADGSIISAPCLEISPYPELEQVEGALTKSGIIYQI